MDLDQLLTEEAFQDWLFSLDANEPCGSRQMCPLEYYLSSKSVTLRDPASGGKLGLVHYNGHAPNTGATFTDYADNIKEYSLPGKLAIFPQAVDYVLFENYPQNNTFTLEWESLDAATVRRLWFALDYVQELDPEIPRLRYQFGKVTPYEGRTWNVHTE